METTDIREKIINNYFNCWLVKDSSVLAETFADNAVYIECYGPAYHGLRKIQQWFGDWNKSGTVLIWEIKKFLHDADFTVCEWYFKCEHSGSVDDFNGVSLMTFDSENKISELKEFQSKTPNYSPYQQNS